MAVDPSTGGYWLVASDGGIFSFNAPFYGSTGAMTLNKPIVGMAADAASTGYWLVASDGGIFSFHAPFKGSMGSVALNKPMVGMAADFATGGYWLVAADGGIFSFGSTPFYGSTGSLALNRPIVGMEANGTGTGYRFVASDGGIFDFGSSEFFGSTGSPVATLPSTAPTTTTSTPAPPTSTTQPPTTTTTTTQPNGTITVSLTYGSAMGCSPPVTPGCPEFVTIHGSDWPTNETYPLTITGPNLSDNTGLTAQTDGSGVIQTTNDNGGLPGQTNAVSSVPPTPGTYRVTMGGVTASYTYNPPASVNVYLFAQPGCTNSATTCTYNIEFFAVGFPPDETLPLQVMWNTTVISQTFLTTDDTGSIWLVNVGTTGPLPFAAPTGTATVTLGGVTGTESFTSAGS